MNSLREALEIAELLKKYFIKHGTDNFSIMLMTRVVNEIASEVKNGVG